MTTRPIQTPTADAAEADFLLESVPVSGGLACCSPADHGLLLNAAAALRVAPLARASWQRTDLEVPA
ncbi:hypothetical protein [Streptomyces sp. NPDC016172]|uniref:hypothetical protein n=1 Tax=Streptomyces sp. NPDC016172 TaxID=3364964 RepID=UPI0036FDB925